MIRKLLSLVSILFVLAVGSVFLLPKLVPVEKVAEEARAQVKKATGRDMTLTGATFVLWPNLGAELTGVTLSNPAWAKEKIMASFDKVNVELALKPLLQRHIEVKRFILNAPVLHLEVGPDGKRSWDFSGGKAEESASTATAEAGGGSKDFAFSFGKFQINKGKLTFSDRKKSGVINLDDINVSISLPDLKSALKVEGGLTYRQKSIDIALEFEMPMELAKGSVSPGHINLKTEDMTVKAAGSFALQGEFLNGNVEAKISSLAGLLAWLGDGQPRKLPFEKVSFVSAAQISATDLILKDAGMNLDEVEAKGNMNISFSGKPEIFARMSVNRINLDRFRGAEKTADGEAAAAGKDDGWDTTPIDLSALKAVNADMELKTDGFSVNKVSIGPSTLTVQVQNGNLRFKSSEASLFDGRFTSDLTINAAATPTMAFVFDMEGVQAKPVLSAFAHFRKLSGSTTAHVDVRSSGASQKALISNLDGKGEVVFRKGSLEGIDLVNIAKLVQQRLGDMGVGEGKTDFVELGGTFTVSNGVASNSDLKMKGPLLQATGKGSIDLPKKYIQYRVIPVLTASSDVENASGLAIPVDIKGPFDHIKVKPDFASVVQNVLNNPDQAKETLKNVKEQGKVIEKNLKDIRKGIKKDPVGTLQNLLGGGLPGLLAPPVQPALPPAQEEAPVVEQPQQPAEAPAPPPAEEQQPETVIVQ